MRWRFLSRLKSNHHLAAARAQSVWPLSDIMLYFCTRPKSVYRHFSIAEFLLLLNSVIRRQGGDGVHFRFFGLAKCVSLNEL